MTAKNSKSSADIPVPPHRNTSKRRMVSTVKKDMQTRDEEVLVRHLGLILGNRDRILHSPILAHVLTFAASFSVAYISGSGYLPMGALLELWDEGLMRAPCQKCSKEIYLFQLGGSPLSGACSWWGICADCHQGFSGNGLPAQRSFGKCLPSILRNMKKWHAPEDLSLGGMTINGKHVSFDTDVEGDGERNAASVPGNAILTLSELIEELHGDY